MTSGRRRHTFTGAVVAGGLAVTTLGVIVTASLHRDTEEQLLDQRTSEAAAVLVAAISGVRTPITSAAEVAAATDGDVAAFEAAIGGPVAAGQFTSAVLYDRTTATPIATAGEPALLDTAGAERVRAMLERAAATPEFAVVDLLDVPGRRLGYAAASREIASDYVVYAESPLPAERTGAPRPQGAFSELDYALYLGDEERDEQLLYASVGEVPVGGRHAASTVEFGDTELLLVATTDTTLGGTLSRWLPWLVGLTGAVLTIGAAALTARLVHGRRRAEELAANVTALYADQRNRTETLQRSLIPRAIDPPPATSVAGRYWPAEPESEIGGDFYDLFPLGGGRWGVTIGDVCGKGIEAAALTGVTRHTIRAAARHLADPVDVLRWTHEAIAAYSGTTYCTACFGVLVFDDGGEADGTVRLDVALGGHPGPLLRRADGSIEQLGAPGTVLGLVEPRLTTTRHEVGAGDTLLFFTDGITDAPGDLAVSMDELGEALRGSADDGPDALADAIRALLDVHRPAGSTDDTALLVIQLDASEALGMELPSVAIGDDLRRADDMIGTSG